MIPFYIYYSMFGFQRIGDLCWAAGDQQARGFLIGGTSGRTTLNGEGLQHEDGHSHIQSLTIPNCISYDPAYAYEVAVIMHDGLERMYGEKQENVYYYITTLNENYHMPAMPEGAEEGIRKGIYKLETLEGSKGKVQLLGSGSILRHVREAAEILAKDYGVGSDVYSVTSFTELARDGQDCERWNMLHPLETPRVPYIAQVMNDAPAVASTDYMKLFAEQVRTYVPLTTTAYWVLMASVVPTAVRTCVTTLKLMLLMSWLRRWANWLNVAKSIRKWLLTQSPNSTSMQIKLTRVWRKR